MRIRIEISDSIDEDELIIKCRQIDESIQNIQNYIMEQSSKGLKIVFYKEDEEYYFPLDDVLFFETDSKKVYAHTMHDTYAIKNRLYELEEVLPKKFVRVSKSTILNIRHIYSIQRNFTAASLVQFQGSHQQVYVSRLYYKNLRKRLDERSYYEK